MAEIRIQVQEFIFCFNPIANYNFPSGVAARNSTFFYFYGELNSSHLAEINKAIDEDSSTLILGLKLMAAGHTEQAISIWHPLSTRKNVLGFIASHNIALARVLSGQSATLNELKALLGKYKSYDAIIFHNLAKIMEAQGNSFDAKNYFKSAYEKDSSSYRIKQEYRHKIFQLSSLSNVHIIDLGAILKPMDFVDYCHPTEEGHIKIARALKEKILLKVPSCQKGETSYKNLFPSPNFSREPNTTLINYYSIDWEIDVTKIKEAFAQAYKGNKTSKNLCQKIASYVENFIQANKRHPIFTQDLNQIEDLVPRSNEILSFPEFYLSRILYNYSQIDKLIKKIFIKKNKNSKIFKSSSFINRFGNLKEKTTSYEKIYKEFKKFNSKKINEKNNLSKIFVKGKLRPIKNIFSKTYVNEKFPKITKKELKNNLIKLKKCSKNFKYIKYKILDDNLIKLYSLASNK